MKRLKYVKLCICEGRLPGLSTPVPCQDCWVATAACTSVNITLCSSLLHTAHQSLKGTQHRPEFSHPCGRPSSLQGLTSPAECLSHVGDVDTWRTVFFFEHQQQSPHFRKALWSNSAVLRGICCLKSSGSEGIESWLYSCSLHCEILLAIEMTLQRESQMRDGLEERINSFPPTFQMTGLLQCSYIPHYAKLSHNTKYYSNTMCDYYNFPSLVHRYYICKHLLICCLWYSVLDRIFLCHSRCLQNFLLLYSSHQSSICTCVC